VSYAGDITPEEAWKLLSDNPEAVLVDCRTDAEWRFVGVPDLSSLQRDVVYIEWNSTDGKHNQNFVAAEAATEAGIAPSYNVLDGFEGNLDERKHRGGTGWKAVGLPWKQS
jgi:rhodanese-related sulfurtransferase